MGTILFDGEDIDLFMGWRPGTASRLARQRRLPHVLLPDGAVRFDLSEIESLIVRVAAPIGSEPMEVTA